MYHGFTIETPYFPLSRRLGEPGHEPVRGPDLGRAAVLSFMLMAAMLDRHPRLRVATLECGHGWLPTGSCASRGQIDYVRGSVSPTLKHTPVEYARWGASSAASTLRGIELNPRGDRHLGDSHPHVRVGLPAPRRSIPTMPRPDRVAAIVGEQATQIMWETPPVSSA